MEEVGLHTALGKRPCLVDIIFPEEKERLITCEEFRDKISFEEQDASDENSTAAEWFLRYIAFIESRHEGTCQY